MSIVRQPKNTVDEIKDHNIKMIYMNCFGTRVDIQNDPQSKRFAALIEVLNVDTKKLRDFVLLQNKDLRDILLEQMPYLANNPTKMEAIATAEQAIQNQIDSIRLKPWTAYVLPELQRRGYAIGLISNIAKAYVPKVKEISPIAFDHMLFSCELWHKKTKHNSDMYHEAHLKIPYKKRETVMVGDHPINDYDAADTYGFYPIHMDRKQKNEKAHRIHTLEDLLDLFPEKQ